MNIKQLAIFEDLHIYSYDDNMNRYVASYCNAFASPLRQARFLYPLFS